jgi:kinesin family protein 6/9
MMIIDEEEFLLILKLKDLKKQYRSEYQELRDLRAEIQYCQRLVDQCRHRLLMGAPIGKTGRLLEVK